MEKLKSWLTNTANIMFDDSSNDLRSLPKTVRLQILVTLSAVWTTVFSLYVFSMANFATAWASLFLDHIGLIIAVYLTFKSFHTAKEEKKNVFEEKNFNPVKIFLIFFVIFFIFIFTKGIDLLNRTNSYSIEYKGPKKTTIERIKEFVK